MGRVVPSPIVNTSRKGCAQSPLRSEPGWSWGKGSGAVGPVRKPVAIFQSTGIYLIGLSQAPHWWPLPGEQ
jgi:hypothetical protein